MVFIAFGFDARARRDAEEAELRVHRVQAAVLAESHPRDVVADGLGAPPGMVGWIIARFVLPQALGNAPPRNGLVLRADQRGSACARRASPRRGHRRGDAQRVALLAQQRVAAVARAVGPDLTGLREVGDVFLGIARPRHIGLAGLQWRTHRMQALDEEPSSPSASRTWGPTRVITRIDSTTYSSR